MSVLDGAVRVGPHVLLRGHADGVTLGVGGGGGEHVTAHRVVTLRSHRVRVDDKSAPARFALRTFAEPELLARRARYAGATLPRVVDIIAADPAVALAPGEHVIVFEAHDGPTLHDVLAHGVDVDTAPPRQGTSARGPAPAPGAHASHGPLPPHLDDATAIPLVIEALHAAAVRMELDADTPLLPEMGAWVVVVGWSGARSFLGHLTAARPWTGAAFRFPVAALAVSLVRRLGDRVPGLRDVVTWMERHGVDDGTLARDPRFLLESAARLTRVLEANGESRTIDAGRVAGLVRGLFPERYREATALAEELALLDDRALLTVPKALAPGNRALGPRGRGR